MTRLIRTALYRIRRWFLRLQDPPAIKELSRQVPAKRARHQRVFKDIQQIRTARLRAQFGRV